MPRSGVKTAIPLTHKAGVAMVGAAAFAFGMYAHVIHAYVLGVSQALVCR